MIRLVQRKLILPRGDTGSFTIPVLPDFNAGDVAVFAIFNPLNKTIVFKKQVEIADNKITIQFSHNDTVNLPAGKYLWDIKAYLNPEYADGKLVNGDQIDSYYASYKLPECQIKETADDYLMADDAPTSTLSSAQLDLLSAILAELRDAVQKSQENVTHYPTIIDDYWHIWDANTGEYVNTDVKAGGVVVEGTGVGSAKTIDFSYEVGGVQHDATQVASGIGTFAEGINTIASGRGAHAQGDMSEASGINAHAEGLGTKATNHDTHAEGYYTQATGLSGHAEGSNTVASGNNSHAEGDLTVASNDSSHAEGSRTKASGNKSHAEGIYSTASGNYSHAENYQSEASGENSHAEGYISKATKNSAHAEGYRTESKGNYSHSEGYEAVVTGDAAHAEGRQTSASKANAHAEGFHTQATNNNTHAQGYFAVASGLNSHAQGELTNAVGKDSHAEGNYTYANGINSHSEGYATIVNGDYSHAGGYYTIASGNNQYVSGKYNIEDLNNLYAVIVGIGTYNNNRLNGYTLDWSGNGWYAGKVSVTDTTPVLDTDLTSKLYVDTMLALKADIQDIPDISGKADKVSNATSGNFASLDANGNLVDSGHKHSDYLTEHQDISGKQDILTFDDSPQMISDNPVKSSGLWSAFDSVNSDITFINSQISYLQSQVIGKQDLLYFDTQPKVNSNHPVTSGGIKTAIDTAVSTKQDTLTFDNAPTANSTNPVTSGGVYEAITNISTMDIHICTSQEYNSQTGIPTIASPDAKTFYLVPGGEGSNLYIEWVYVNNAWQQFGSATIDLSSYALLSDIPSNVSAFTNDAGYLTQHQDITGKQDVLTFDNVPTINSVNPVVSNGIYTAINNIIKIQETQPVDPNTKLWIHETNSQTVQVPTVSEVEDMINNAGYLTQHQDISGKADKSDTVLNTTLSRGRSENSIVGTGSFAFGMDTVASGAYSHAEGQHTTASSFYSHAEGSNTRASGSYTHAEGAVTTASGSSAHSEGINTTASGSGTHAEGMNTTASGRSAHAEGEDTTVQGNVSHAEGANTEASGNIAHAEGTYTEASGLVSHAEGAHTTASGDYSHAEGTFTIAAGDVQHVSGKYNIQDLNNKYAEIVGIGTYDNARANGRTLDWNGNAQYAGKVSVGNTIPTEDNDLTSKEYVDGTIDQAISDSLIQGKYKTISNQNIVTFDDAPENVPLKDVIVNIEPIQNLNGYDNPWPAGGGVNKASYNTDYVAPTENTATINMFTLDLTEGLTYTFSCKQSANLETSTRNTLAIKPGNGSTIYENTNTNYNPVNLRHVLTFTATVSGTYTFMYWGHTLSASITLSEWQVEIGSSFTSYSPYSNICPINGWTGARVTRTGKNLIDISAPEKVGYYNTDGTYSGATAYNCYKVMVAPETTYTISGNFAGIVTFWDADMTFLSSINQGSGFSKTFTTPTNCTYIRRSIAIASIDGTQMLELGSTATDYEPYQGTSYDITFPTEAGTVYGGTLDVTNGTLTVDRAMVDLGTLNYSRVSGSNNVFVFTTGGFSDKLKGITNIISDCFVTTSITSWGANKPNDSICGSASSTTVVIRADDYENATDLKTYLSGHHAVYELATPITYILTPQEVTALLGINHIWSNSGSTSITYASNVKAYVDSVIPTKLSDLIDDSGHYTKPASGIPASDLANNVIPDISNKIDKVNNAIAGNFAALDANGNLTDSGSKASDFLTEHQDITGKADKVENATAGNFAALDVTGNIVDSGKGPDDITDRAPVIVNSASGAVAAFEDGADEPVEALSVAVEPVQDLHGYANPWPGGGGKNLMPMPYDIDKPTAYSSGWSGTTLDGDWVVQTGYSIGYGGFGGVCVHNLRSGTYTFSFDADLSAAVDNKMAVSIWQRTTGGNVSGRALGYSITSTHYSYSVTFDDDIEIFAIRVTSNGNSNTAVVRYKNIQIESGSVATAYEPYANICPISGWTGAKVTRTGKNLANAVAANIYSEQQCTHVFKNGGLEIESTGNYGRVGIAIKAKTGEQYTISMKAKATDRIVRIALSSESNWGYKDYGIVVGANIITNVLTSYSKTITAVSDTLYLECYAGSSVLTIEDIQLELGSTATAYEPYQGTSYSVTFPSEVGTVYGGTLDVTNGTLTVDRATVDLGSLEWAYNSSQMTMVCRTMRNDFKTGTAMCSNYVRTANMHNSAMSTADKVFGINKAPTTTTGTYGTGDLVIKDSSFSDTASFKAAMSGVQLVYELATPITYTFTPQEITTLFGSNRIWADCGNTAVDYCADTKMYVDGAVPVQDVQVNGTSILSNGVANVPIASSSTLGVMKINTAYGLNTNQNGELYTLGAGDTHIKDGDNLYRPITPGRQHRSVFYGLAKAAGDTTQSQSDNAVGTYTDDAKSAIRSMLGAVGDTDYASGSNAGVIKIGEGVYMTNGALSVIRATDGQVKIGAASYRPVVPASQHLATFYGLAKAAGDTTQAGSDNAVGTYTETAQSKIHEMLDAPVTVSGTDPVITGKAGIRYICGECATLTFTPPASGIVDIVFESGTTPTVLSGVSNIKWPSWFNPESLQPSVTYELNIMDGRGVVGVWT